MAGLLTEPRRGPFVLAIVLACLVVVVARDGASADQSFADRVDAVQPKIVKIHGAGGFQRLEAYQSGFLISADGYVLTVWSYVLDTDYITVTLNDGRKFKGELKGYDPRIEIAILKIDAIDLPHFNLLEAVDLEAGNRVLAFSNLYGVATGNEAASVMHGSVSVKTNLVARSKTFQTPYHGPVYVLDAMTNNPGSAGGALTDRQGRLAGVLGKELRNSLNNTWLNYALPITEINIAVEDIIAGRLPVAPPDSAERAADPLKLAMLGIVLVPDVLNKTPPFIEYVRAGTSADKAGLQPDDLILFVNNRIAQSCKSVRDEFTYIDRDEPIRLTIQRRNELIEVELSAAD